MGGADDGPALQVIVLGSGGGPVEHNTTAFLVRSLACGWGRGSIVAVDAGVHLGAIARILEKTQPGTLGSEIALPHMLTSGPFTGLEVPNASSAANAAHITQSLIDTYLITHPHLDHISAFVVNTAGLPGNRPKRLAGLPSTISAFKTHIFNNVIWPNLSDENNGAGLVTYTRLVDGGSPAVGDGEGKGYLEISDGHAVKVWSVSHGHCIEKHSHRGSSSSQGTRYGSFDASAMSPRANVHTPPHTLSGSNAPSMSRAANLISQAALTASGDLRENVCVYDSSAYFIRDIATGKEVLIFGDVEPDSISLSPRNLQVWQEAGPKIAAGTLGAVFIECSYDDSQGNDRLFGHLKPVFIMEELRELAREVELARQAALRDSKKRKRGGVDDNGLTRRRVVTRQLSALHDDPVSPKTMKPLRGSAPSDAPDGLNTPHLSTPTTELTLREVEGLGGLGMPVARPLQGLKVVIVHMKDKLSDEADVGENILAELLAFEKDNQLGCEFVISYPGQSIYL